MNVFKKAVVIAVFMATAVSSCWAHGGNNSFKDGCQGKEIVRERDNYYRIQGVLKKTMKIESLLRDTGLSKIERKKLEKKLLKLKEKEKRLYK